MENEDSIIIRKFLDYLSKYELMKNNSFPWNWLGETLNKFILLIKTFTCKMSSSVCVGHHLSGVHQVMIHEKSFRHQPRNRTADLNSPRSAQFCDSRLGFTESNELTLLNILGINNIVHTSLGY
jgi:hypothetical protein